MAGKITVSTINDSSGVLATQNGMTGIAKAWVNFNGVPSTPTVNSQFNVSSVVKNSTGNYTVNFTTAMSNSTYAVHTTGTENTTGEIARVACIYGDASTGASGKTTSAVRVVFGATNAATFFDSAEMNVSVFN